MAKEYTSKKAQFQQSKSIDAALSDVNSSIHWFSDRISSLDCCLTTGKNDSHRSQSLQELLAECKTFKSNVRSDITKLKSLDPDNAAIKDYEEQYKELSNQLKQLSAQIGDMPIKKSSRKKSTDNDDDDDEPSESDLRKQYIASLHFDIKNANKLTMQLGQLSNKIMTEFLNFSLTGSNYNLARSKFKEGLLILRKLEPDNPMVSVYDEQIKEWNKKHQSNQIKRVFGWIGIVIGIIVFFSFCMIMSENKK